MARKKVKQSRVKTKKKKPNLKGKSKVNVQKKGRKSRSVPEKITTKNISGREISTEAVTYETRGIGAKSAGQAGDTQGLPKIPVGDTDSVEGLLEEGQTLEAEILEGVESARDADKSEVKTRQLPADDVPEEYLEKD